MRGRLVVLALGLVACSGQEFSAAGTGGSAGSASGGSAGVSGGSSVPTDGLVLWLDAEKDVDAQGSAVVTWHDRSAAGNSATQGNTSARPNLEPTALNGHPAVRFDGNDDELELPAGFDDFSQGVSFFAVVQSASPGNCPPILQLSNGSEVDDISFQREGTAHLSYEVGNDYFNGTKNLFPSGAPLLIGVTHGLAGVVRLFGTNASEFSNFPVPPKVTRKQNFVGYGLYAGCTRHDGWIAELMLYRRKLTDAERDGVQAYLVTKWGL